MISIYMDIISITQLAYLTLFPKKNFDTNTFIHYDHYLSHIKK